MWDKCHISVSKTAWIAVVTLLLYSSSASATWKDKARPDRLTGETIHRLETRAVAPVEVRGRVLTPSLVLQCIKTPAPQILGTFIVFDNVVSFSDTSMRYRIDGKPVEERGLGASRDGTYFQVVGADYFLDKIKASKRLRVEIRLPTTDAYVEFDTSAANEAIAKAACR